MPVRCPKCAFESADDAGWCDFCKEPFRKAPAIVKSEPAPVDPDKLLAAGDGESLPKLPPWFRAAAWTLFGLAFIGGMILAGLVLGRAPRPL